MALAIARASSRPSTAIDAALPDRSRNQRHWMSGMWKPGRLAGTASISATAGFAPPPCSDQPTAQAKADTRTSTANMSSCSRRKRRTSRRAASASTIAPTLIASAFAFGDAACVSVSQSRHSTCWWPVPCAFTPSALATWPMRVRPAAPTMKPVTTDSEM